MRKEAFRDWLADRYIGERGTRLSPQAQANRVSVCGRVERFEGDLDKHFARDGMQELLGRFVYSKRESASGQPPRHHIQVDGDAYSNTAFFRSALALYRKFCLDDGSASSNRGIREGAAPATPRPARMGGRIAWPTWPPPTDEALLTLARHLAPHVRFLHPDIVRAVVADNERRLNSWSAELRARGIDPPLYLWPRCATAFPGVRRFAGSTESAQLRKRLPPDAAGNKQALRIDDNGYPRQIWSFALRGGRADRSGPPGYSLAHLADHKAYGSRLAEEFMGAGSGPFGLPGLFTSAANVAYVPDILLRPTDAAGPLRNLLHRRAADLYGQFCSLLPHDWTPLPAPSGQWVTNEFEWADPVGDADRVGAFLDFRAAEMQALFATDGPD